MSETIFDPSKIASEVLKTIVVDAIKGSFGKAKDVIHDFTTNLELPFQNYLLNSLEKYAHVKTILYKDRPVRLYDIYEPLSLSSWPKNIPHPTINEIEAVGRKVIITGTAGSGKSTLTRHLFINTIAESKKIPIYCELRLLNFRDDSIEQALYSSMTDLGFGQEYAVFLSALQRGRFVIFLDGFDEVQLARKGRLQTELIRFTDKYKDSTVLLTSRPEGGFSGWQSFHVLRVEPLRKTSAISLISKLDYELRVKEAFVGLLQSSLFDRHQELLSIPLLLTIMLMTFREFAEIPSKRHLFFDQVFETLWRKHDASKSGYRREIASQLDRDDFVALLSTFCILGYLEGLITFDSPTLFDMMEKSKKIADISVKSEEFIYDLLNNVCLIAEDGVNFTFLHRTIQEYFAAKYIANCQESDKRKFISRIEFRIDSVLLDTLFEIDKSFMEIEVFKPLIRKYLTESHKLTEIEFSTLMLDAFSMEGSEIVCSWNPDAEKLAVICQYYRQYCGVKPLRVEYVRDPLEPFRDAVYLQITSQESNFVDKCHLSRYPELGEMLSKSFRQLMSFDLATLSEILEVIESRQSRMHENFRIFGLS